MAAINTVHNPEYDPYKVISAMKYVATHNFIRENSLCRDAGEPVYDAKVILDLVPRALETCGSKFDKINIHEQEFLAALNLGKTALAKKVFEKITQWFPSSKFRKTRAYEGFILELEKNYERARNLYNPPDNEENFCPIYRKRLIAICLAEGDRKGSIAQLVDYLDIMAQDTEGWSQLAKLYLYESMYHHAAFCYEELMLINTKNHVLNSRCADVVYTLGRPDLAIKYYCKSLSLFPDYLHALYGVYCCANMLLTSNSKSPTQLSMAFPKDSFTYDKEKIEKLLNISYNRIKNLYAARNSHLSSKTAKIVSIWLESK